MSSNTAARLSDPNTELHEKLLKAAETIEKNAKDKKNDKTKSRIITQFNVILVGVLSATLAVKAALNTTSIPSTLSATSPPPPVPPFGSIRWLPFFYVQLALTVLIFGGVTSLVQFATFTLLLTNDTIFDCKPQAELIIWATTYMLTLYFCLFVSLSKPPVMLEWFVVVLFVVINVAWGWRSHLMVKVKAESEELPTHIRSQGCNCFQFKNLFRKKTPVQLETLPEYQLLRLVLEDIAEQGPVDEAVRSALVEVATHLGKQMEMRRMRSGAATPFEISSSRT